MWILTEEYNDYDQHGEYFIAAWNDKPTLDQLLDMEILGNENLEHILNGGGRVDIEYQWFNLHEYKEGTAF